MDGLWSLALVALGGLLTGGTIAMWKTNRILGVGLGTCAILAVTAGVLNAGGF